MIKITFPDGTKKEFQEGITSLEIASKLVPGWQRKYIQLL